MDERTTEGVVALSLVIPTYNRADLIAETIESALGQTRQFAEIIIVDDGSTDHTREVLRQFEGRIRVVHTPNRGVQAARNTGVAVATSDYVSFCDSDDLLEPEFVRKVTDFFVADPSCDIIYCNFYLFDGSAKYSDKFSMAPAGYFSDAKLLGDFLTEIPDLYRRLIEFQPMFTVGNSMKKEFFHAIGGYRTEFNGIGSEDLEFLLRAVGNGKLGVSKCPLGSVRKHLGNESANAARQAKGEALILEYSLANHPHAAQYKDLILASVDKRRLSAFHGAFAQGNFELAEEMLGLLRNPPWDRKFLLKRFVLVLPSFCRAIAWRFTQA